MLVKPTQKKLRTTLVFDAVFENMPYLNRALFVGRVLCVGDRAADHIIYQINYCHNTEQRLK